MPRANYRHRCTIQRITLLEENEYFERELGDPETVYTNVPCLAVPDVRPVAVLNAEISEPNRDISRLYWIIDIGQYYVDDDDVRRKITIYSGDIISSVVNRKGEFIIENPTNVVVRGRKWDGWRVLAEEHMDRYEV